jgi:hypothetical protein
MTVIKNLGRHSMGELVPVWLSVLGVVHLSIKDRVA